MNIYLTDRLVNGECSHWLTSLAQTRQKVLEFSSKNNLTYSSSLVNAKISFSALH